MKIIKLKPKDWRKYKAIRLEAVENEPLAFAQTKEAAESKPDKYWSDRLEPSENLKGNSIYFVEENAKIVGMAGVQIESEKERLKHIANIFGVFMSKPYRGKGWGRKLLQAILNDLEKRDEIKKIKIGVNPVQVSALNLYRSLGFEEIGTLRKELKIGNDIYDEVLLEKYIHQRE